MCRWVECVGCVGPVSEFTLNDERCADPRHEIAFVDTNGNPLGLVPSCAHIGRRNANTGVVMANGANAQRQPHITYFSWSYFCSSDGFLLLSAQTWVLIRLLWAIAFMSSQWPQESEKFRVLYGTASTNLFIRVDVAKQAIDRSIDKWMAYRQTFDSDFCQSNASTSLISDRFYVNRVSDGEKLVFGCEWFTA